MNSWKELEEQFRLLYEPLRYARVDGQWGAAGEYWRIAGTFDKNSERRFLALARIAGEKLITILEPNSKEKFEVLDEQDPIHRWYKAIWKIGNNFEYGFTGEQKTETGKSAGFIHSGTINEIAEASSVFCLELSAKYPEQSVEKTSFIKGLATENISTPQMGIIKKFHNLSSLDKFFIIAGICSILGLLFTFWPKGNNKVVNKSEISINSNKSEFVGRDKAGRDITINNYYNERKEEDNKIQQEKEKKKIKLKIKQYIKNFNLEIDEFNETFFKKSKKIVNHHMEDRRIPSSSTHLQAQIDHAKNGKKQLKRNLIELENKIKTEVLEIFNTDQLELIPYLKDEFERLQNIKEKINSLSSELEKPAREWDQLINKKRTIKDNFTL